MIYKTLAKLTDYSIKKGLISNLDVYVVRNQLMEILNLSDWVCEDIVWENETIEELLNPIIDYAVEQKIIADTNGEKDLFDTKVMGVFTPMPREINREFVSLLKNNPEDATNWYYDFSKDVNYVRALRIAKDQKWEYDSDYGTIDITINLSKPEKDPRDIAAARNAFSASYPKCQLCAENAGFKGHSNHPARQNLRPVSIKVNNEEWQMQYSPYGYYNEHSIFFNTKHIPMKIDSAVFDKMFDIIEYLPHYFVGSNADLPIVGGSILSHEHFQGGRYTFAMEKAEIEKEFVLDKFPLVKAGIVKWPMSVIRVSSKDRKQLAECCSYILEKWRGYSDDSVNIFAFSGDTPHNTITPISRMKNGLYECDLVLRNNITTVERPMGLYHPNPSLHHIKKENIGLIEVMGLAVLPARLSKEIKLLEKAILEKADISNMPEIASHAEWAEDFIKNYDLNESNITEILQKEIGKVFANVLEDAGVFKRNQQGFDAFSRFINSLN